MTEVEVLALDEELAIASASSLRARAILRRLLSAHLLSKEILGGNKESFLAKIIELRPKLEKPPEGGV